MSGWLTFLHCDQMLTRERIWIQKMDSFILLCNVKVAQVLPAAIIRIEKLILASSLHENEGLKLAQENR